MQGSILGFGQVYLETSKDSAGNGLHGGESYRMRVKANPPVTGRSLRSQRRDKK
jgi:hypothetical protein